MVTIFLWVLVGFLTGLTAKAMAPDTQEEPAGTALTTGLGILGAIVGGMVYDTLAGIRHLAAAGDYISVAWAALGAVAVVIVATLINFRNARDV